MQLHPTQFRVKQSIDSSGILTDPVTEGTTQTSSEEHLLLDYAWLIRLLNSLFITQH